MDSEDNQNSYINKSAFEDNIALITEAEEI